MPRLSVVVPFWSVERYLGTCLASLARQTFHDLEVVLVDDGSPDGSRAIAEEWCARDSRFRLVTQENQGLGPARNTGVDHASGDLVAFVDGDDLVPRHAYELLVGSLDASGSDLAAGDARRFTTLWVRESLTHRRAFATSLRSTHVRDEPLLVDDRMAWNKVYRRALLDDNDLRFPAMLYEDFPVTMAAHLCARSVDVLRHPIYYWREREGGEPSITQARWDLTNVRDRVRSAEMVLDLLEAEAPDLVPPLARHLMRADLDAVVAAVHEARPEDVREVLDLGRRLLARLPEEARATAPPFERVQAALLERDDTERLRSLLDHRDARGVDAVRRGGGPLRRQVVADLPFRGDRAARVPETAYRTDEASYRPELRVEDATWDGGRLHLRGWWRPADAAQQLGRVTLELWLGGPEGRRVGLSTDPSVVADHDPEGRAVLTWRASLNPYLLGDPPRSGRWRLHGSVGTGRRSAVVSATAVGGSRAAWSAPESLGRGWSVQPQPIGSDGWGVVVRQAPVTVSRVSGLGPDLEVLARFAPAFVDEHGTDGARLVLTRHDTVTVEAPGAVEVDDEGVHRLRARVPVSLLDPDGAGASPVEDVLPWTPRVLLGDRSLALAVDRRSGTSVAVGPGLHVRGTRTRAGNLVLNEGPVLPALDRVHPTGDGHVVEVSGYLSDQGVRAATLVLRRWLDAGDPVEVRVEVQAVDGTFGGVLDLADLVGAGTPGTVRLLKRPWQGLVVEDGVERRLTVPREVVSTLPPPTEVDGATVRLGSGRADSLVAAVRGRPSGAAGTRGALARSAARA